MRSLVFAFIGCRSLLQCDAVSGPSPGISFALPVTQARAVSVRPDVVFATSTPLTIAIPGIYASMRCRVPMVFEVFRGSLAGAADLSRCIAGSIDYSLWQAEVRADRVSEVASDRGLLSGMKEGIVRAGYPKGDITVIPNSCDLDSFLCRIGARFSVSRPVQLAAAAALVVYTGARSR